MSPTYDADNALAQYDDAYKQAKADDYPAVPDGNYQVAVTKAELRITRESKRPMLAWQLQILSPRHKGRFLFRNQVVTDDDRSLSRIKRDLKLCGLELERFSDLGRRCKELEGLTLEVTQKTHGEYVNLYLNKRLTIDAAVLEAAQQAQPSGGGSDDNIPF